MKASESVLKLRESRFKRNVPEGFTEWFEALRPKRKYRRIEEALHLIPHDPVTPHDPASDYFHLLRRDVYVAIYQATNWAPGKETRRIWHKEWKAFLNSVPKQRRAINTLLEAMEILPEDRRWPVEFVHMRRIRSTKQSLMRALKTYRKDLVEFEKKEGGFKIRSAEYMCLRLPESRPIAKWTSTVTPGVALTIYLQYLFRGYSLCRVGKRRTRLSTGDAWSNYEGVDGFPVVASTVAGHAFEADPQNLEDAAHRWIQRNSTKKDAKGNPQTFQIKAWP